MTMKASPIQLVFGRDKVLNIKHVEYCLRAHNQVNNVKNDFYFSPTKDNVNNHPFACVNHPAKILFLIFYGTKKIFLS